MGNPQLSVIIPCVNGRPYIDRVLAALKNQNGDIDAEIIVLNCCRDDTVDYIKKKFPTVHLSHFPERLSIPELRSIGMACAKGDVIAVIEDHCIPQKDWFSEIVKAHESDYSAVGGVVENGSTHRITDWAVFFCEYSSLMPPLPYGEVENVAGNNVSYKREILEDIDESVKKNYWEFFLHAELRKRGHVFLLAPTIVVHHQKEFGFFYFLKQRFYYSQSFAGMRKKREALLKRIGYILSSPFLPALLIARIMQQVIQKKSFLKEFTLSMPLLIIFMLSYACGECIGYIFGPGKSLIKVE